MRWAMATTSVMGARGASGKWRATIAAGQDSLESESEAFSRRGRLRRPRQGENQSRGEAAFGGLASTAGGGARREAGAQLLEADAGQRLGAARERGPRAHRVAAGGCERPAHRRLAAGDRDGGERFAEFGSELAERGDLGRERRVVARRRLLAQREHGR